MQITTITTDDQGNKRWFNEKGKLHRLGGPAYKGVNGDESWYINGKLHRKDGPAVRIVGTYTAWYLNDKKHRIDGPAVEWDCGDKEWYVEGVKIKEEIVSDPIYTNA